MTGESTKRFLIALALGVVLFVAAHDGNAQQLILKGEYGMKAGTQPPPGLYVGILGGINLSDELKGPNGNNVPSAGLNLTQNYFAPLVSWVTDLKIFGGNYAMAAAVPFTNVMTDFPLLQSSTSTGLGLSQLWIVPFSLGWHFPQADLTVQYAFYPPTGRYTPGATNNTGLGMWCIEYAVLGTAYLDPAKNWHLAAGVFYDVNGKKKDLDWKTGNPLTLMWGFGGNYGEGKSLFQGWLGLAGYAQWQVTATTGSAVPLPIANNATEIFAVGPEFTTLKGALTIRYFFQFGGTFSTQGQGLYVQFVMPL